MEKFLNGWQEYARMLESQQAIVMDEEKTNKISPLKIDEILKDKNQFNAAKCKFISEQIMDNVAEGINQLSDRKRSPSPPQLRKGMNKTQMQRRKFLPFCQEEDSDCHSDDSATKYYRNDETDPEEIGVKYYAPSFHKKYQMNSKFEHTVISEEAIRAFTQETSGEYIADTTSTVKAVKNATIDTFPDLMAYLERDIDDDRQKFLEKPTTK